MQTQYSVSLDSLKCRTCLSVGRRLRPLAVYSDVFRCIMGSSDMLYATQMLICWECEAVLRSVMRFQNKVYTANSVLGQTHQGSLSSLAINVIAPTSSDEESNTKHLKQDGEIIQKPTEFTDDEYDYADDPFHNSDDKPSVRKIKMENDPYTDFINDETVFVKVERLEFLKPKAKRKKESVEPKAKRKNDIDESEVSDVKTKSNIIRLPKKTLEKPRYNFVKTTGNTKEEDMYTRVAINETELAECRARERESEFFKKRKKKCEECLLGFRSKSHLQRHMNRHTKAAGNYTCDVCTMRFASRALLAPHRESHRHKLVCRACSYESYTSSHMSRHYRKHHDTTYQCRKCRLQFARRSEFTEHYKQMHERFICDHCGTQFKMRYMMIKHMRKRHLAIKCGICGTRYSSRYGLKVHRLRLHSSAGAGAAYCVECDMQFPNEFKYKNHLKTGARHKPRIKRFPCEHCDKMFWKQCDLRAHRNMVHLKICRFRCDDCGQRFGRKCNLLEHRRVRHERRSPSRDKVCQICARGFTTKQSLNRHMMIHTGERPFVCALCSASFNQRSAMNTHVRNVHKLQHRAAPPPPPPPHT